MYGSAPRHESRAYPERASRSTRSTRAEPLQRRPYVPLFEEEDRTSEPYLAENVHVLDDRDYQYKRTSSGTDLREAQRLAANFFSQHPSAVIAPEPVYREAPRFVRPLSPEVSIDRYPRGQNMDWDAGLDRWAGRPNLETVPSSRSQLLIEDWEEERLPVHTRRERDMFGFPALRERKRDDTAWDDNEYDYGVVREETDFSPVETTSGLDGGGLRVTKRLDWTGLFRADGGNAVLGEEGFGLDVPFSKRGYSQTYGGVGSPFVDSYRAGVDELAAEESAYSRRLGGHYGTEGYRSGDFRKEPRVSVGELLLERDEYLTGRNLGIQGGERGGRRQEDWKMNRETSAGQVHKILDSDRGKNKRQLDDGDSRRPFESGSRISGGGSGSWAQRPRDFPDYNPHFGKVRGGKYGPKRDFSQRASITNKDILAVYYGNPGPGKQANAPTRGHRFPGSARHDTQPNSERYPVQGRSGRQNVDVDPVRKGSKRWEKPALAVQGKRFKRETQSDKLYLMHNNRAKSDEEEPGATVSLSVLVKEAMHAKEGNRKGETSEPAVEDLLQTSNAAVEEKNPLEPSNGLWDSGNSWSDSEDNEKQTRGTCDGPSNNDVIAGGGDWDQPTSQALESGNGKDPENFPDECPQDDEDDGADWESFASVLDDQLGDVCVHHGLEAEYATTENPQVEDLVASDPKRQASEEGGRVGSPSAAESQDSETVDIENCERQEVSTKDVAEVGSSSKEGSAGTEKKKLVVVMEELQESVKNREEKAFDAYVSLFDQDMDLRKLYDASVNSRSFECLVCAGVGAKKKKNFPDGASLVQHAMTILRTKKLPEHRGFARAVSKILQWETVPGPSVILPRGCDTRQQSEPVTVTVAAPKHQAEDGGNGAGLDWEWAAARQLFEEQEARISQTTESPGVVDGDSSAKTAVDALQGEGKEAGPPRHLP